MEQCWGYITCPELHYFCPTINFVWHGWEEAAEVWLLVFLLCIMQEVESEIFRLNEGLELMVSHNRRTMQSVALLVLGVNRMKKPLTQSDRKLSDDDVMNIIDSVVKGNTLLITIILLYNIKNSSYGLYNKNKTTQLPHCCEEIQNFGCLALSIVFLLFGYMDVTYSHTTDIVGNHISKLMSIFRHCKNETVLPSPGQIGDYKICPLYSYHTKCCY